VYLDNAATTFPKPEAVYAAADRFARECGASAGRGAYRAAVDAEVCIAQSRASLARLLGAPDPRRILFTAGATDSLNLALKGLLRPGDRVVVSSMEHNSVARPLRALESRGVELVRVPCPGGRFDPGLYLETLDRVRPSLAAAVHAGNVSGELLPVEEIALRCGRLGIPFLVDAAQTAGCRPLDVSALGRVLVAASGHKGLLGLPGVGILYVAEGVEPTPWREGGTGSASGSDRQPETFPDRFESGTPNGPGIAALGAAVDWILERGVDRIAAHLSRLSERLVAGLSETPGIRLIGPPAGEPRGAVVSFVAAGWQPGELAAVLDEACDIQCRAGLHCAPWACESLGVYPSGTVRLSPGIFQTEADMGRAVAAIREVAAAVPA
jgi:cysteine desulfurase family protein